MPNLDTQPLQNAVEAASQLRLCSIFDRITPNGEPPPKKRNAWEASILTAQNIVTSEGGLLSESLRNDLARLAELHPDAQEDTYFYLLQKHGWRIGRPDGGELQDVAFCDSYRVERALDLNHNNNGYLLVKGDLSGIQEYIYGDIQQKTAGGLTKLSKRLRGRSILVTLLTDFLANIALRELDLPIWNLLFAGGGHFNLLLPDTPEMQGHLKVLTEKLDSEMRRRFDDRLQLNVAVMPCSKDEISNNAGRCFERLNAELKQKKYRQHQKYLQDHFYPPEIKADKNERDEWEISIGQRFPKLHMLIEAVSAGPVFLLNKLPEVVTLEMHKNTYTLLAVEDYIQARRLLENAKSLVAAQVFTLNETNFLPTKDDWKKVIQPVSFGFRLLGKYVPAIDAPNPKTGEIENRPKTFEEIAQTDDIEMLGAIRLDVDDLGYIFSHGMPGASLPQIVTLSRELHYFFSAHFDNLAQKHQLYLIYSGGDDAFAVGQWKNLIKFTQQLQTDFQTFVFGNQAVHFSAGIFLGDPKYPVGRFYLDTGELLQSAKDKGKDKLPEREFAKEKDSRANNTIHIFHQLVEGDSFDKKIKFGTNLAAMLKKDGHGDSKKLSMAFAYRLLTLVKTSFYERAVIENGIKYKRGSLNPHRLARNISSMHYLFARNGYDKAKTDEVLEGVEKELITDFFRNFGFGSSKEQSIRDNLVALNYALYTIRSQKNNEP